MKIGDVITNKNGSLSKVTSVSKYGNYYSAIPLEEEKTETVEEEKTETVKKSTTKRKK